MSKEISNPYSTGGGGTHFENRVQSAFTVLMLAGGFSPCLPPWPITEIKLQGKYQGFETDDLIVHCGEPNSFRKSKLLGQIKHTISFTMSDGTFQEVLTAAWQDFNNNVVFSAESGDAIVLICGLLSGVDTNSVRPLLEQARSSKDSNDFINRIGQAKFTSNDQREKLEVFKHHLKIANNDVELTDDQLWRFLKSFHLLIYDLDIKGVVHSLLHTLIELYSRNNSKAIWAQIYEHIQWVSERAGFITLNNISHEIKEAFKKIQPETIPEELVKDTSKIVISNWNDHELAPELAIACIIGSWDENNVNDKSIISKFVKVEYEKWIPKLREVLQYPESPLDFKNGIWRVKDTKKLWTTLGSRIFDDHLNTLKDCAIQVLSELDPKFELQKDQRFAAKVYGKVLNYSNNIRKGITEALALTGCLPEVLVNCSLDKPNLTAILSIREIFKDSDWVLWASLNDLLTTLAESSPQEFINIVDDKLRNVPDQFTNLFTQEGNGVTGWNYITGLLWALEALAWEEEFLVNVTVLLGELAKFDPGGNWVNRPFNTLTTIFLPWKPQTNASFAKRKVAIQTLDKEFPEITWKLLLTLLPHQHQISTGTYKPKFRKVIIDEKKILVEDYREQVNFYAEMVVEKSKDNIERLEKVIAALDNLPQHVFNDLLSHLSSEKIVQQSDEIKINLWNVLVDFTSKHKRFSDAKWALPANIIKKIDSVADKLKPKDPILLYARLFSSRDIDLYEEKGNWEKQHKKLDEDRQKAIKEILSHGDVDLVLDFINMVDRPMNVGNALGAITDDSIDEKLLPKYLEVEDKKIKEFIRAFLWRKFYVKGWGWVDKLISRSWSKNKIAILLTYLPFILETWGRVSEKLSESESLYWTTTSVNPYHSDKDLTPAIDKLIEYGRPYAAIDCIYRELFEKKPLDIPRTIKALKDGVNSKEQLHSMQDYHITEIIKALQINPNVNEIELAEIEWIYLLLLDEHTGEAPKTLELRLASDPAFFCEIIQILYRSKKVAEEPLKEYSDKDKNIATQAWHLLDKWKTTPGMQKDGSYNEELFKNWLNKVKEYCSESGHLEVALQHIGKVLFYGPEDESGFWINKIIAEELNKRDADDLRKGFTNEVFNSRGAYWVDPTGEPEKALAEKYKTRAEETENANYQRLAVTLRKISESYEKEAEYVIDEHKRDTKE